MHILLAGPAFLTWEIRAPVSSKCYLTNGTGRGVNRMQGPLLCVGWPGFWMAIHILDREEGST